MDAGEKEGCGRWCYRTCCLSKKERKEIKLLLIGTGESGKTTFIKQMRIIQGNGFSEDDRRAYAKLIYQNIFTAIKELTVAMTTLKIPYANPQNEVYSQQIQEVYIYQMKDLNRTYVEAIHELWADTGIKLCYSRRREYQLMDSTEYFMKNLDRITSADYIPTTQDVLRVHFPTTGINDYSFSVEKITLRIFDVGGTKSERRKWIHCFENVTSMIYLASLSEYDQVLVENDKENRMRESLSLFYTTIHSPWFASASIILFLNKMDILAEKIQTSDLQTYFPNFQGKRQDLEEAKQYIYELYKQKTINAEKEECKNIHTHFICATDTNKIRKVFNEVKNTVLFNTLKNIRVL